VCEHKAHILQSSSNINLFKFSAVDALQWSNCTYLCSPISHMQSYWCV